MSSEEDVHPLIDNAVEYLGHECRWLELLLQRQVLRLRKIAADDPDNFRGLYIADAEVDALLANSDDPEAAGQISLLENQIQAIQQENSRLRHDAPHLPLEQLKARFGLSELECRIFLVAVAAELDLRYQTLYAYVQNDVTRKLPTVDLALKLLCSRREEQWAARKLFSEDAPLFRHALVQFADERQDRDLPLPSRSLKVPRRVTDFLLGEDALAAELASSCCRIQPRHGIEQLDLCPELKTQLQRALPSFKQGGVALLRGREGSGRCRTAQAVCHELGLKLVVCDLNRTPANQEKLAALLGRECLLSGSGLYLKLPGFTTPELEKHSFNLMSELEDGRFPIFIASEKETDSRVTLRTTPQFRFSLEVPELSVRRKLWKRELNGSALGTHMEAELSVLAGKFRFTPGQIRDVVSEARNLALLRDAGHYDVDPADVYSAARIRCNTGLQKLAHKVELLFQWNDLVLPGRVLRQLREVVNSVRLRHIVHAQWRFDLRVGKNSGINVLFSGLSGTGKTMAASVLARELNLELYKIDLSSVVSKYIGETEKNLNRIFDEAEYSSAVLFFDEADALFGKRSEVKDAHDRHANIEVAFLLQRIEQFSGLAILATNISRNMDSAFTRRMQHIVEFPFPDAGYRERIWRGMFPAQAPLAEDVDIPFLARQFDLSGGHIRNVVMGAAFLAAEQQQPISMRHLVQATGREYQKIGKLPSRAEFLGHFDVISTMANDGQT